MFYTLGFSHKTHKHKFVKKKWWDKSLTLLLLARTYLENNFLVDVMVYDVIYCGHWDGGSTLCFSLFLSYFWVISHSVMIYNKAKNLLFYTLINTVLKILIQK